MSKIFLIVALLSMSAANADTLTIHAPLRSDVFTGRYEAIQPLSHSVIFNVTADAPFSELDKLMSSDMDSEWAEWTVTLCDDGHCGDEIDICRAVIHPNEVELFCQKVDC